MPPISRRRFLQTATAAAVAAGPLATARAKPARLPAPALSGIDHVVILCMENRSFDHYLGWLPGADGRQAGLSYADDEGTFHDTHRLETFTGCGFRDPGHSAEAGARQVAGGAMDGFRLGDNDGFAIGYYEEDQLEATADLARRFTIGDRWFCSFLGPTFPNRIFSHSGRTDRDANDIAICRLPTIWDRLDRAGVDWGYYFHDVPVLALWGTKYLGQSHRIERFFAQAANGTLPAVTYLDPSLLTATVGLTNDDHPHSDIRRGQALVSQVANAVITGPRWRSTVLVVMYDEWGGFFDHVPPATLADGTTSGLRTPNYLISPFARTAHVEHEVLTPASVLRMIEWRFRLAPLARRDATATNLATVLDFSRPNRAAVPIVDVDDPGRDYCAPGSDEAGSDDDAENIWQPLMDTRHGRSWQSVE